MHPEIVITRVLLASPQRSVSSTILISNSQIFQEWNENNMTRSQQLILGLSLLWVGMDFEIANAQTNRRVQRAPQGQRGSRPGSAGASSLHRVGLEIGKTLPSVNIFDDQGKEFSTASLKGSYTVLTFGCLT